MIVYRCYCQEKINNNAELYSVNISDGYRILMQYAYVYILLFNPKKVFWPKKGHIGPKTGIFGQISALLAHLI